MIKICRVKQAGNFGAVILSTVKTEEVYELRDPTGLIPLFVFDEINEALELQEDAGKVYDELTDDNYNWELLDSE